MLEVGRICMKTAGREAGKYCVVVKKIDENFVMVTGPKSVTKVKRRRCNINHLEPTSEIIKIKPDASDDEILKAYQLANIFAKFEIEKPEKVVKEKPGGKEEKAGPKVKKETKAETEKKKAEKPREKKESKPETKGAAKTKAKMEKTEKKGKTAGKKK